MCISCTQRGNLILYLLQIRIPLMFRDGHGGQGCQVTDTVTTTNCACFNNLEHERKFRLLWKFLATWQPWPPQPSSPSIEGLLRRIHTKPEVKVGRGFCDTISTSLEYGNAQTLAVFRIYHKVKHQNQKKTMWDSDLLKFAYYYVTKRQLSW